MIRKSIGILVLLAAIGNPVLAAAATPGELRSQLNSIEAKVHALLFCMNRGHGCAPSSQPSQGIAVTAISPLRAARKKHFLAVFQGVGGDPMYSWRVTSGALPPGLVLVTPADDARRCTARGCPITEEQKTSVWLEGTSTQEGVFSFEVTARDRQGADGSLRLTITVAPAGKLHTL